MKTAEEKAAEYALKRYPITDIYDTHLPISNERSAVEMAWYDGYSEAMRWRDPKEGLPNRDMQVVIKGGILKNEVGPDIENDYSAGYYDDGVWYVSPTDYYSIEIENPTGWKPIE